MLEAEGGHIEDRAQNFVVAFVLFKLSSLNLLRYHVCLTDCSRAST